MIIVEYFRILIYGVIIFLLYFNVYMNYNLLNLFFSIICMVVFVFGYYRRCYSEYYYIYIYVKKFFDYFLILEYDNYCIKIYLYFKSF